MVGFPDPYTLAITNPWWPVMKPSVLLSQRGAVHQDQLAISKLKNLCKSYIAAYALQVCAHLNNHLVTTVSTCIHIYTTTAHSALCQNQHPQYIANVYNAIVKDIRSPFCCADLRRPNQSPSPCIFGVPD